MDAQVHLHFINHGCGNVVIAAISWGIILSSINPWRHIGISTTSGNLWSVESLSGCNNANPLALCTLGAQEVTTNVAMATTVASPCE